MEKLLSSVGAMRYGMRITIGHFDKNDNSPLPSSPFEECTL